MAADSDALTPPDHAADAGAPTPHAPLGTLPASAGTGTPATGDAYRLRLLNAMAQCVSEHGYGGTTIGHIVAEAAVSRRTFYEQFADKAECLLALYEQASLQGLEVLRHAIATEGHEPAQLTTAFRAYLGWMASRPSLLRALFVDILALDAEGLDARRRVNEEFARFIVQAAAQAAPQVPPPTHAMALALVGAVQELVLERVARHEAASVAELAPIVEELTARLVLPPRERR